MKRIRRLSFYLIGLALVAGAIMPWSGHSFSGLELRPAQAQSQSIDKEGLTQRLISLEESINSLTKLLAGHPDDSNLESLLAAATAEYESISSQLGGDRAPVSSNGLRTRKERRLAPNSAGVIPPAPPACSASTSTFTNSTPVGIVDNTVVTSTINVSGAGPSLYDLNVTTFITHTFAADLDITITSPAGTVVTLTTDNGSGNDNVFNGTVWDDDANPGGQVPYASNNDLVAEHVFANNVLASPLVPEEALGAFIGENPNGTWTIRISDDAGGDTGSLNSWSLELTTLSVAPFTGTANFTNSTPVAITDNAVVTSTINVSGAGTSISDLNVTTFITHTFAADLDITITSPAGTVVTLTTDNGSGNDNVFNGTVWDDDCDPGGQVPYTNNQNEVIEHTYSNLTLASPLLPEEALAAFTGENPNGTWTIRISDDAGGDTGSLNSWSLNLTTATCACQLTCPANITVSNDPNQCGAVVNYPAPTTSGTCGTVTCAPASGSFFPKGVTMVTCSEGGGGACAFTITVGDTQPPTITCPANQTVVSPNPATPAVVNYPTVTASDNCPGVVVVCNPPSGSSFPPGTTTVTCTATDASGNTATCSFTVSTFDIGLQDDSGLGVLLWNSASGQYRYCVPGTTFTGVGTATTSGNTFTLTHNPTDRRLNASFDNGLKRGSAALQSFAMGKTFTIADRNTTNDTYMCP